MAYAQSHTGFWLCSLTPDMHARTCNYWWTLTTGATAHTAFRTEHATREFFARVALPLPELTAKGVHGAWAIPGTYRTCMHMGFTRAQFEELPGVRFRCLSNGQYTQGIAETCADGIVTIHTMNPNCQDWRVFDYWESSAIEDLGAALHCRECRATVHPLHKHCPVCVGRFKHKGCEQT